MYVCITGFTMHFFYKYTATTTFVDHLIFGKGTKIAGGTTGGVKKDNFDSVV